MELASDMKTVVSEPKATLPNKYSNTEETLRGHAFFEASSIRKIRGKYYFIYIPVNYLMNYVMLFQMHRTEFSDIEVC